MPQAIKDLLAAYNGQKVVVLSKHGRTSLCIGGQLNVFVHCCHVNGNNASAVFPISHIARIAVDCVTPMLFLK